MTHGEWVVTVKIVASRMIADSRPHTDPRSPCGGQKILHIHLKRHEYKRSLSVDLIHFMSCHFWHLNLHCSSFVLSKAPLNIMLLSGAEVVYAIAAASRRARNAQHVLIIGRANVV